MRSFGDEKWCQALIFIFIFMKITFAAKFSLEIISPGNYRQVSVSSMPITAPAIDLAVDELNRKYPSMLSTRVTYLYDKSSTGCEDLIAAADFLVSDYYYRRNVSSNATVFIFPGMAWGLLMIVVPLQALYQNMIFPPSFRCLFLNLFILYLYIGTVDH